MSDIYSINTSEIEPLWITKYYNIVVVGVPWHLIFSKIVFPCENITLKFGYYLQI